MIQGGGGYFIRRHQNEYKICNEIFKKRGKKKKLKKKKEIVCSHVFWLIKKQKKTVNSQLTKLKLFR